MMRLMKMTGVKVYSIAHTRISYPLVSNTYSCIIICDVTKCMLLVLNLHIVMEYFQ